MHLSLQAGAETSYAREAAEDEAALTIEGHTILLKAIDQLLRDYDGNYNLLQLRAHLVEETKTLGRRFSGAGEMNMMAQ